MKFQDPITEKFNDVYIIFTIGAVTTTMKLSHELIFMKQVSLQMLVEKLLTLKWYLLNFPMRTNIRFREKDKYR